MNPILVVEDEVYLLELYADELKSAGFEVRPVTSGKEALELVKTQRPGLVVLDIKLGDMDGLRVLEEIKGHDRTIPVILNSAYAVYKDDFSSWIADEYILKSSDVAELISKVKTYAGPSSNAQQEYCTPQIPKPKD